MQDEICQCHRHPDSAFTVIALKDGRVKCPRCGGIVKPKDDVQNAGGRE